MYNQELRTQKLEEEVGRLGKEVENLNRYKYSIAKQKIQDKANALNANLPPKTGVNKKSFLERIVCKHLWGNYHYLVVSSMIPDLNMFQIRFKKECLRCGSMRFINPDKL